MLETVEATAEVFTNHTADTNNPHSVTKEQVGLSNVDNTADMDKPVSNAVNSAINTFKEEIRIEHAEIHSAINTFKTENSKEHTGINSAINTLKDDNSAAHTALDERMNEVFAECSAMKDIFTEHIHITELRDGDLDGLIMPGMYLAYAGVLNTPEPEKKFYIKVEKLDESNVVIQYAYEALEMYRTITPFAVRAFTSRWSVWFKNKALNSPIISYNNLESNSKCYYEVKDVIYNGTKRQMIEMYGNIMDKPNGQVVVNLPMAIDPNSAIMIIGSRGMNSAANQSQSDYCLITETQLTFKYGNTDAFALYQIPFTLKALIKTS